VLVKSSYQSLLRNRRSFLGFYGLVKELNPQLEQEAQRQAGQQYSLGGVSMLKPYLV
jgi:hypothetical protein